jgi:hypothetical protein
MVTAIKSQKLKRKYLHERHLIVHSAKNITERRHKQAEKVVRALSTKDGPPEDGQTTVTETCRVLIDVFYKHF